MTSTSDGGYADTVDFVDSVAGVSNRFRRRQGTVTALGGDYTISVQIAGDTSATISGVRYLSSYMPKIGSHVWLDTDGKDVMALGVIAGQGGPVPYCRVYRNANYTQASGTTPTAVTWTNADTTVSSMFTASSPNVTLPLTGLYAAIGHINIQANSAGRRHVRIVSSGALRNYTQIDGLGTGITALDTSTVFSATAGDVAYLALWQDSAATLTINSANSYDTHLEIYYLGPAA